MIAGTRIGPYEIVSAIGAGGMGEVYRARDTRLDRDVAIKVLPEMFVSDADRLSRFEREAKTLASLNHPNVAQIFGTEQAGNIHALAMELVDGEDLSQRLARGRLPIDDALQIARQVAEALEAAHERGIVHRDLKPGNVKVRPDGTAKVLDFGLAKAVDPTVAGPTFRPGASGLENSPTFTSPVTQMGVILGTAAYMSPDQAKGKPVDRASDMWAFGALLFEMLTGRPAFAGETVTDILAAIVTRDPDWTALPPETPASITRLLHRCLERDRRRRLQYAGEARFQIEEALASPEAAGDVAPRATARLRLGGWIAWSIAALLAISLVALGWRTWRQPAPEVARYNLDLPAKAILSLALRPAIAISADGRTVVFVASVDGIDRLYVRRTDAFDSTLILGTEGGSNPVIAPDGRTVAFTTATRVMKVPLSGGPAVTLAEISEPRGLSWDVDDSILFVPFVSGGIWKVPAAGGSPVQVTKPVSDERTHRWPQMLPGGALLFTVGSPSSPDNYDDAVIAAQMPDGSRRTVLTAAAMARYAPTGHLIFARRGSLFSVPFDPLRAEVKGTPAVALHDVAGDSTTGAANFAVSASGTLAYISARDTQASMIPMWVDSAGRHEPAAVPAGMYADVRLSPDGQQMAVTAIAGGGRDVWVHHFQRLTFTRMTFGGQNLTAIWSRDGSTMYYSHADSTNNLMTIMRRPADGSSAAEAIVTLPGRVYINDIAPDERSLVVNIIGGENSGTVRAATARLARLALEKDARPTPLVDGTFDVFNGRISPDARWLAYVSLESGLPEVYVRPFAGGTGRWPISTGGGEEPTWAKDGSRLYYRANNVLMGVTVARRAATFESSTPAQLVAGIYNLRTESGISYDVDPKNERFLMIRLAGDGAAAHSLRLIANWHRELK